MTERAKKLLLLYYKQSRKIRRVSGLPPLTFKAKKAGTLKNYRIYGNTETKTRFYSGSAPLSFPIADGSVSNYRIYGNTVNGESVGDLVESGEHAGEYKVAVTVSNGTDTQTIPIYLPEQIRKVGDEAEYIDYGEQKLHRVRGNYLQSSDFEAGAILTGRDWKNLTYQDSKTPPGMTDIGGVVFDTTRKRFTDLITISGTYTISIADGWEFGIVIFPDGLNSGELFTYNTSPITISNCTFAVQLRKTDVSDISSADISDYKIMLNKGAAPIPYEPYIENTDLDVTLPALPTVTGTNTLTVGTEVQPSSVAVDVDEVVSCGDRTENLFDMKKFAELCYPHYASVTFADNTLSFTSTAFDAYVNYVFDKGDAVVNEYRPSCIDVLPSTTYTISMSNVPKCYISWINSSFKAVSAYTRIPANQSSYTFTTPINCTKLLICLGKEVAHIGDTFTISNITLNAGSDALPYEPYGYKIPVTLTADSAETTDIYLDEPLAKSGNNADYIDYATQKRHNSDGTESSVTLPEISTLAGTNTLTVGTEVQPSSVEIKGRIKAAGGD